MTRLDRDIEAKYEVLAAMGEGGMGAVYKVRHRHLDEIRVVKVLRERLRGDAGLTARFLREARTAVRLRHPNIAEVIDYDVTSQGTAFIVMEFIEGVTLAEIARREGGALDRDFVIGAALQTLAALAYLHGKGFVHRDISPDNLMLTGRDGHSVVKLIDLGIAKSIEATKDITVEGHFVGKVRYASPEQFTGTAVDARSDLYSLGVVLYELLTGYAPITGSDYKAIIAGHLTSPPRDFAETDPHGRLSAPLRAAVLRALAKEPEGRYANAAEFAVALQSVVSTDLSAAATVEAASRAAIPDLTTQRGVDLATRLIDRSTTVQRVDATTVRDSLPQRLDASGARTRRSGLFARLRLPAVGLAAVAVALAVFAVTWILLRPRSAPVTGPATPPTAAARPASPAAAGQLVLNGLPWAEVVEVRGSDGRDRVAERPLHTPAVLTLEPGAYRVRFANPVSGREATVAAEVKAGQAVHCQARLDDIDAAAWLRAQP